MFVAVAKMECYIIVMGERLMTFLKERKKFLFNLILFIALLWFGNWMGWEWGSRGFEMPTGKEKK